MRIERADIVNFKNIAGAQLEFAPTVNCVLGRNGMGKSNLLEAVHYLSFLRGFRSLPDSAFLRHGESQMMIKGLFAGADTPSAEVSVGFAPGKRKSVKCDGKEYQRHAEHIGRFPVVLVAPTDSDIITGAAQERRRFMDMVISQADHLYLIHLMRYNRALESRNRMLRSGIRDEMLYESVEAPLCEAATQIHAMRARWVEELAPLFQRYYTAVAGSIEHPGLAYKSVMHDMPMAEVLKRNLHRDTALGYTSAGVHRDDLEALLDGHSLRGLGSQGQIKSYTVALKFAVYEFLKSKKGSAPILLLDDIFDKLDATRVERIMEVVAAGDTFGQIFVTDTNREHIDRIVGGIDGHLLLQASDGHFTPC